MSNSRFYNTLFKSEPMKVGKHEWRLIVYDHPHYERCTDYEWRPTYIDLDVLGYIPPDPWQSMKEWPRYNFNDGMHAGCPKSLVKLYRKHKPIVDKLLAENTDKF